MNLPQCPQIVSPDVHRENRIPPRQVLTHKWPVLHAGPTPTFDRVHWSFHVWGEVEARWQATYDEFIALPKVDVHADMHCVTRWSKLDNRWHGVSTREVMKPVKLLPSAKFVMVHCEHGFTTNLPLADFLGEDCVFAWGHNGQDLEPDHGWPLRLVVPKLYAWKSAKWVRGLEFLETDQAGFWESWEHGGYHMRGDPWNEERFR
ncbi:MAG: sulfite oxidase-like oxidoreductase [Gemmataceae bacterium]|nr:sulfite oxidase-like oxidoreductase [Gemmataceae bacterium]